MSLKRRLSPGGSSLPYKTALEEKAIHDTDVIEQFLVNRDCPSWYRGTSKFQHNGAKALFYAIRDDSEQWTAHRTRACLTVIGIEPLISAHETKKLMRLSRGNDLAFLWFLLEVHYKTPGPSYSLNEQLIMSCITVLDLITTLRELDRILPPGHPPLAEIKRQERLKRKREQEALQAKRKKRAALPKDALPYFHKLSRPKPYGKPLTIPMPDFKVAFGHLENYKNPNFNVPNESNRWYSKYELHPGKRIANRIINEEIETIFSQPESISPNTETVKTLCEHHKIVQELEESLEQKLRLIARDRCLKLTDVELTSREARQKRIKEQLDRDVDAYLCKFRKIAQNSHKKCAVQLLSNKCPCGLQLLTNSTTEVGGEGEPCGPHRPSGLGQDCDHINVERHLRRDSGGNIYKLSLKKKCNRRKSCSDVMAMGDGDGSDEPMDSCKDCQVRYANSCGDCGTLQPAAKTTVPNKGHITIVLPLEHPNRDLCKSGNKLYMPYDYGHSDATTPTTSQTFFAAPAENQPYQFDYRKIFRFKENTTDNQNIRRAFVEALDNDVAQLPRLDDAEPDVSAAVHKCAEEIWQREVANKNRQLEREQAEMERTDPALLRKSPLNYDQEYYDPNDSELMSNMLKDALEYMARDPTFVLASLPEAHKVPVLREWIMHRYGKVYSRKERTRAYSTSMQIFRSLDKFTLEVPMPNTRHLGRSLYVDYSCRDYLLKKSDYIKKEYYKHLDAAIMDQARIFWFAMRPYLCSSGPPRNTYYAYMPSRRRDISRFRLWKPTEFMNAKGEWERRMCRKNKTEF